MELPLPDGSRLRVECPPPRELTDVWRELPWWEDACAALRLRVTVRDGVRVRVRVPRLSHPLPQPLTPNPTPNAEAQTLAQAQTQAPTPNPTQAQALALLLTRTRCAALPLLSQPPPEPLPEDVARFEAAAAAAAAAAATALARGEPPPSPPVRRRPAARPGRSTAGEGPAANVRFTRETVALLEAAFGELDGVTPTGEALAEVCRAPQAAPPPHAGPLPRRAVPWPQTTAMVRYHGPARTRPRRHRILTSRSSRAHLTTRYPYARADEACDGPRGEAAAGLVLEPAAPREGQSDGGARRAAARPCDACGVHVHEAEGARAYPGCARPPSAYAHDSSAHAHVRVPLAPPQEVEKQAQAASTDGRAEV